MSLLLWVRHSIGLWISSIILLAHILLCLMRYILLTITLRTRIQVVTMATIKVFDANGVKELQCFDTLDDVEYMPEIPLIVEEDSVEEDSVEE